MVSNLEKMLNDEKQARLKMKDEIEDLKRMNSDLCNAILTTKKK
jgi:hypothetical protein